MSRLQLRVSMLSHGGTCCHQCGKKLDKRTIQYQQYIYPYGTAELIPVCQNCNEGVKT